MTYWIIHLTKNKKHIRKLQLEWCLDYGFETRTIQ